MARPAAAVTVLLAVVVLVSVAASLPSAVVGDARFVARTCKRTNHTECVKMLSADRRSARATTVHQLAGIAVDIAAATVKSSATAVYGKFLENHGQVLELTLLECWWMYDLAAGEAQAAVRRLQLRRRVPRRGQAPAGRLLRRDHVRQHDRPPLEGLSGGRHRQDDGDAL